ncbi:ATP-binding cassette glutathione S-conjugate transporter ycf1, partial [Coemansia erecta]
MLSRLTYHWVLRFLQTYPLNKNSSALQDTANDKSLDLPWLTPLSRNFDPETLSQRFDKCWQREINKSGKGSLISAIVRAFAADLWLSSFLRLLVYFNDVAQPLLVARIIQETSNASDKQHATAALFTLLAYAFLALVGALIEQNQIDLRDRTALKIRISLTAAVHNKVIMTGGLLSSHPHTDVYSSGIHSTEQLASHIVTLSQAIWLPVRVVAGLYVFYRQVGWAVAPGIAVILLYLPLRTRFISQRAAAQKQAAKASIQRVFLITQLFDNIVSLRMLNWDGLLVDKIAHIRKTAELGNTIKGATASLFLTFARAACRAAGPLVSLFIYSTLSQLVSLHLGLNSAKKSDRKDAQSLFVTAEQVFVVQAILRELFPLLIDVPHAFDSWWDAKLPYQRVFDILTLTTPDTCDKANDLDHDLDPIDEKLADDPESLDIRIVNGTFKWQSSFNALKKPADDNEENNDAFSLKAVNLNIRRNQLVAVVGIVGSGKSSLLSAVLGEMALCSGLCQVARQTAFVSQTPWLMAGTVRENIVFGKKFDSRWYAQVIELCELSHDLNRWSAGDQTVIGSNGLALSGGQRMRVALARAVYSEAKIFVLDDILAAVDSGVSQRLIGRLIAGENALLVNTTRLVVTRDPRVLLAADGICIVDNGRVLLQPCPLTEMANSSFANKICSLAGISADQLLNGQIIKDPVMDSIAGEIQQNQNGWSANVNFSDASSSTLLTPPSSTNSSKVAANSA